MKDLMYYKNSYGETRATCTSTLKERKKEYVEPEVLELLERIEKKGRSIVSINNIGLELGVHLSVVSEVFKGLNAAGLLEERDGGVYKITRKVQNEEHKET